MENDLKNSTAFLEIMKLVKKNERSELFFRYVKETGWGVAYKEQGFESSISNGKTPKEAVENLWRVLKLNRKLNRK